jgi:hypothetical protein
MKWIGFLKPVNFGAFSVFKFIIKHWYWFIFAIVLLPAFMSSIQIAQDTSNPLYPLITLGLRLSNADHMIFEDVKTLEENPSQLIQMSKPDKGIVKNLQYGWRIFLVMWRFFGNIWLIAFPFIIIYKFFKIKGSKGLQSSKSANATSAIIIGLVFILIINLALTINGVVTGDINYNIPADTTLADRIWIIFVTTIPFKGILSLILYLKSTFI